MYALKLAIANESKGDTTHPTSKNLSLNTNATLNLNDFKHQNIDKMPPSLNEQFSPQTYSIKSILKEIQDDVNSTEKFNYTVAKKQIDELKSK